jgi:hypothetical protein
VTYKVQLEEAGFYRLFAMASSTATGNNEFYVKIDQLPMQTWDIQNGATLAMTEVAFVEVGSVQAISLTKGAHTIVIKQGLVGGAIDKLVLTKSNLPAIDKVEMNPLNYPSLRFDLSKTLGATATLSLNLIKSSDKTYIAQNPAIINKTNKAIKIRGIYPLVDGKFIEQNSLYTVVDTVVTESIQTLSESASVFLIGTGEAGEDPEISISFDVLELTDMPAGADATP